MESRSSAGRQQDIACRVAYLRPAAEPTCHPNTKPRPIFWVDPKEELTAIYMSQAPSSIRAYYRKLVKQLVYGALTD